MEVLTANQAKTHFGETLLKAQKEPVCINKNGKPVAMMVSMEDYRELDEIKLELIKARAVIADKEIKNRQTVEGDDFFQSLLD